MIDLNEQSEPKSRLSAVIKTPETMGVQEFGRFWGFKLSGGQFECELKNKKAS